MLSSTKNNNIFIHNCDQELFPTTILELLLLIIFSLTLVYLKVIADI